MRGFDSRSSQTNDLLFYCICCCIVVVYTIVSVFYLYIVLIDHGIRTYGSQLRWTQTNDFQGIKYASLVLISQVKPQPELEPTAHVLLKFPLLNKKKHLY